MTILGYITTNAQPLAGLCIGIAIFAFISFLNWYGDIKARAVEQIAHALYGDHPLASQSADGIFMYLTSVGVLVSGILIILALLFLTNTPPVS